MKNLQSKLERIDGKGYKAYKELKGLYHFEAYRLSIDHVQGDPYAAPSRISVQIPIDVSAIPNDLWAKPIRILALGDYLGRSTRQAINKYVKANRGLGKSGEFFIDAGGQEVLQRSAVNILNNTIDIRMTIGLPAKGRSILAKDAYQMLFEELPNVIQNGVIYRNLPTDKIKAHVDCIEDQQFLRQWLLENNRVAFIANGSSLPRSSGIDDRPLTNDALPFCSPDTLLMTPELPNAGPTPGMAIPKGVTLIVGGGFHGKSTLLHALERGVYYHIPNDGRERVATDTSAVKIRAEDGRSITSVNIQAFIDHLPFGRNTQQFTTENASGSTSQAANIIEALECGASLLLIDEDTSATNFMIRDERMQALVTDDKEPITPFLHRVRELYDQYNISTVIVMGGSGDYFEVADTVIMMDTYQPTDVTARAHELSSPKRLPNDDISKIPISTHCSRIPDKQSLNPARGNNPEKINARGKAMLSYGNYEIDLSYVEQCVDICQTRAIGLLIRYYAMHHAHESTVLIEGLTKSLDDVEQRGLDILSPYKVGNLALPRLYELAAAVNRIRNIRMISTD